MPCACSTPRRAGRPTPTHRVALGPLEARRADVILSDRDIRAAVDAGRVGIEPFDPSDVQPSSIDLHVDRFFRTFHNQRHPYIDVRKPMDDLTELVEAGGEQPFILHPGEFVLGQTLERVTRPYGSATNTSKYQGQAEPTPSRFFENFDRGD